MGYFIQTDAAPRKRMSGHSRASPKTHTPGSRLKERGQRFYSPGLGRWLSRDLLNENAFRVLWRYRLRSGQGAGWIGAGDYVFVENDAVGKSDALGLQVYSAYVTCNEKCKPEIVGCDKWPKALQATCEWHEQQHIAQHPEFCKMANERVSKGGVTVIRPCCKDKGHRLGEGVTQEEYWDEECGVHRGSIAEYEKLLEKEQTPEDRRIIIAAIKSSCSLMQSKCTAKDVPAACDKYK